MTDDTIKLLQRMDAGYRGDLPAQDRSGGVYLSHIEVLP